MKSNKLNASGIGLKIRIETGVILFHVSIRGPWLEKVLGTSCL